MGVDLCIHRKCAKLKTVGFYNIHISKSNFCSIIITRWGVCPSFCFVQSAFEDKNLPWDEFEQKFFWGSHVILIVTLYAENTYTLAYNMISKNWVIEYRLFCFTQMENCCHSNMNCGCPTIFSNFNNIKICLVYGQRYALQFQMQSDNSKAKLSFIGNKNQKPSLLCL